MYLHECGLFLAVCSAKDLRNGFVATGAIESQQDQRKHFSRKDSTVLRSSRFFATTRMVVSSLAKDGRGPSAGGGW
jgi:hypothetical protein